MSGVENPSVIVSFNQDTIQTILPVTDTIRKKSSEAVQDQLNINEQKKETSIIYPLISKRKSDSASMINRKSVSVDVKMINKSVKTFTDASDHKNSQVKNNIQEWRSYKDFNTFLHKDTMWLLSETYNDSSASVLVINKPADEGFNPRSQLSMDWIFWTFLIVAFLFIWIQVFYRRYIVNLFNSVLSFHASAKLLNEKNLVIKRVSTVLNFIYMISISLVIFRIIDFYNIIPDKYDELNFFLIILNVVILYSVIKTLIVKIIGFLFNQMDLVEDYLHNIYVYNKGLGIIIIPITFAAFYTETNISKIVLFGIIVIYSLSLLFKIIRSFQINIKYDIFIFYSILYLCTLEILPALIGYKIIKTLF